MSDVAEFTIEPQEQLARLTAHDGLLSAAVNEVTATTTKRVVARVSQFTVVGNDRTHTEVEVNYRRQGDQWVWDGSAITSGPDSIASVTHRVAAQAVANITNRAVIQH